ncbi:MAG: tetratricopeptide repeat protein, partial [Limisphaerales bacterium]
MTQRNNQQQFLITLGICFGLVVLTVAAYLPVMHCGFVYDDIDVVTENLRVQKGLSIGNVVWAFEDWQSAHYWVPVTVLSHMLDCQLFGLNAEMHHLTSLTLHIITAVILFLLLQQLTGARWRSFFVAGIFALHPLHVESVAWIAERKDILSALFFFLTIWMYADWVKKRGAWRYLAAIGLYVLAVMSKPMVVTLPFVLLLLDIWPLGRYMVKT